MATRLRAAQRGVSPRPHVRRAAFTRLERLRTNARRWQSHIGVETSHSRVATSTPRLQSALASLGARASIAAPARCRTAAQRMAIPDMSRTSVASPKRALVASSSCALARRGASPHRARGVATHHTQALHSNPPASSTATSATALRREWRTEPGEAAAIAAHTRAAAATAKAAWRRVRQGAQRRRLAEVTKGPMASVTGMIGGGTTTAHNGVGRGGGVGHGLRRDGAPWRADTSDAGSRTGGARRTQRQPWREALTTAARAAAGMHRARRA